MHKIVRTTSKTHELAYYSRAIRQTHRHYIIILVHISKIKNNIPRYRCRCSVNYISHKGTLIQHTERVNEKQTPFFLQYCHTNSFTLYFFLFEIHSATHCCFVVVVAVVVAIVVDLSCLYLIIIITMTIVVPQSVRKVSSANTYTYTYSNL